MNECIKCNPTFSSKTQKVEIFGTHLALKRKKMVLKFHLIELYEIIVEINQFGEQLM